MISDSYDVRTTDTRNAADGVASGDLPGAGNPCGRTTPVDVVAEGPATGTDEGRGMLELVHDLAPDASLAFASADPASAFPDRVAALRDAGADVLVDDITYLDDPSPAGPGQRRDRAGTGRRGRILLLCRQLQCAGRRPGQGLVGGPPLARHALSQRSRRGRLPLLHELRRRDGDRTQRAADPRACGWSSDHRPAVGAAVVRSRERPRHVPLRRRQPGRQSPGCEQRAYGNAEAVRGLRRGQQRHGRRRCHAGHREVRRRA